MSDSNEGLILHLRLDEMTDGQVADASGKVGPGTVSGTPELVPDDAFGSRLIFDGVNDFVALGNPPELQIIGNQTIEMWLRPDNFSQRRNPYAKAYGGEGTITQEVDGRLNYYHGTNGGNGKPYQGFTTQASIPLNEWTHVAVVRDLDNLKLYWYINGMKTDEAKADYPAAKAGSLEAYVGKGYTQNYAGSIANLRIYNRALAVEEIRQDMATDQTASAAFRRSHPLEFRLYDEDDQPAIFISDDPTGGALFVEVSNVSPQTIRAAALSEPPDPNNYHLELRFRPDTLSATTLGSQGVANQVTLAGANGWRMSAPRRNDNGTVSLYFLNTESWSLDPNDNITLPLRQVNAAAGSGARGTRVECLYQQLRYAGDETTPLSGQRLRHLNIVNHQGRKHIPLHVGFTGSNTILNDGASPNALTLRLTNVLKDGGIVLNPKGSETPSQFILSFDVQAEGETKDWALGTSSQVANIEVNLGWVGNLAQAVANDERLSLDSNLVGRIPKEAQLKIVSPQKSAKVKTAKQVNANHKTITIDQKVTLQPGAKVGLIDDGNWQIEEPVEGQTPEWILTSVNKITLEPDKPLQIEISNIISSLPTGHTNLYLRYENIPGYWDGQFVVVLEKSPLLYRGNRVGIGSATPQARLHVVSDGFPALFTESSSNVGTWLRLKNTSQGESWNIISTGSNNGEGPKKLLFKQGDAGPIRMTLDNAGNVGVGTHQPAAPLHVLSTGIPTLVVESSSNIGTWLRLKNTSQGESWNIISTGSKNGEGAGKLLFKQGDSGPIRMTLDNAGNVGIGLDNPGQTLVINGTYNSGKHPGNGMSYTGNLAIRSNAPQIDFIDTDNNDWSIHVNSNKLYFIRQPWNYQDLVLDGNGNVGIGTDGPGAKLDVKGTVKANALQVGNTSISEYELQILKKLAAGQLEFDLYNTKQSEYLYAADYAPYDNDRRRVFTWRPGDRINQGRWRLTYPG